MKRIHPGRTQPILSFGHFSDRKSSNASERTDLWEFARKLLLPAYLRELSKTTSCMLDTHSLILIIPAGHKAIVKVGAVSKIFLTGILFSTRALLC